MAYKNGLNTRISTFFRLFTVIIILALFHSCTKITGHSTRIDYDTEYSPVRVFIYNSLEDMALDTNLIYEGALPKDYTIFEPEVEHTTLYIDVRFANNTSNWHQPRVDFSEKKNINDGGTSRVQRIIKQTLFEISDSIVSPPLHTHLCLRNIDNNAPKDGLSWRVVKVESLDGIELTHLSSWTFIRDDLFTFYRPSLYRHHVGTNILDSERNIKNTYPNGVFGTYLIEEVDSTTTLKTNFEEGSNIEGEEFELFYSRSLYVQLIYNHPEEGKAIITLTPMDN